MTGEINPETLPEPQRQSSALSSSFNMGLDGLDTSSTIPAQHSRRRRDITNTKSIRTKRQLDPNAPSSNPAVYILPNDGVYLLVVYVGATSNTQTYTANVHVEVGTHFNNILITSGIGSFSQFLYLLQKATYKSFFDRINLIFLNYTFNKLQKIFWCKVLLVLMV